MSSKGGALSAALLLPKAASRSQQPTTPAAYVMSYVERLRCRSSASRSKKALLCDSDGNPAAGGVRAAVDGTSWRRPRVLQIVVFAHGAPYHHKSVVLVSAGQTSQKSSNERGSSTAARLALRRHSIQTGSMAFHHALPSANFFALLAAFVSHSAMLVQSVEPMTSR